jgi:hypothetical protein
MPRKQLEQLRECVDAQLCWALSHCGDQELLDLLRLESDRLSVMIQRCRDRTVGKRRNSQSRSG